MASEAFVLLVNDALLGRVRLLLAGMQFDIGPAGARGIVTVYDGVAGQPPAYPYVIVGDYETETPFHTLSGGDPNSPHFGGTVRSQLRVVTRFPTTKLQTYRIFNVIKGAIDGQEIAVAGHGDVLFTCENATLLPGTMGGGPNVWELVADFEAVLHQAA